MTYIPAQAKCNVCACTKGEENNWYMIELKVSLIRIYQFSMDDVAFGVPCVCGRECLQKFIEKSISVIYPPSQASNDVFTELESK